ncbi:hypothetical protein WH8501_04075 [Crocosphaera watsonii WH 8501]|uniref:hypothetical protein n=1 Tax=Crocosphaera watsonii TaxID=263511 RepID=UPI000039BE01|nr:hypothetical protein [Crocosphaera watsonii]
MLIADIKVKLFFPVDEGTLEALDIPIDYFLIEYPDLSPTKEYYHLFKSINNTVTYIKEFSLIKEFKTKEEGRYWLRLFFDTLSLLDVLYSEFFISYTE